MPFVQFGVLCHRKNQKKLTTKNNKKKSRNIAMDVSTFRMIELLTACLSGHRNTHLVKLIVLLRQAMGTNTSERHKFILGCN